MSTSATGSVVGDDGGALANLTLVAEDVSAPFPQVLTQGATGQDGTFTLHYPEADIDVITQYGPRRIRFRVLDRVHRQLAQRDLEDVDAVLAVGTLTLRAAEHTGWLVTLGKGEPTPDRRDGNALGVLVDDVQAWQRIAKLFRESTTSIELMQLSFDVPGDFNADTAQEDPQMVLQFADPPPTVAQPRRVSAQDARPERLLFDATNPARGVDVRIMIDGPVLDSHLVGASVVTLGLGFLVALVMLIKRNASLHAVKRYFAGAGLPKQKVQGATSSLFGPTHAKLAVVDGLKAVGISSPFEQSYYGDAEHAVDDPRRGNKNHTPIHDVSFAVNGPAVFDLHEAYRLHWNQVADAADKLGKIALPPAQTNLDGLDAIASLQVVRTLTSGRFDDPAHGEQGVLEAYLRAIANAQDYIYLENQYLTNDTIGDALVQALTDRDRPNLNVIALINIDPDIPCYPRWQRQLITRIRQGMIDAGKSDQLNRFGVFTRWTHEAAAPPDRPRPRIVPNYVHSKVAIVDGKWATVGSANLDGSSLDYTQLAHAIAFGDVRNSEVNILILEGADGSPPPVVDQLRRRLWAEHLGLENPDGTPNPGDALLTDANKPTGGWVNLWHGRAGQKLTDLHVKPGTPNRIRVLAWPKADKTLDKPREHLTELLTELLGATVEGDLGFDPLKATRRFSFKTGLYTQKAPEVDGAGGR